MEARGGDRRSAYVRETGRGRYEGRPCPDWLGQVKVLSSPY